MKEFIFEILKENKELKKEMQGIIDRKLELHERLDKANLEIEELREDKEELIKDFSSLESNCMLLEERQKATQKELLIYKNEFQKLKNNSQPEQPKKKK